MEVINKKRKKGREVHMDAEKLRKHNELLKKLHNLPRQIAALHGTENIPAFVLHDLCHQTGFNFPKAAYLVDNPDFDCLKGIAGFDSAAAYDKDIWQDPASFTDYINKSPFNQKVRTVSMKSLKRGQSSDEIMSTLAQQLDLKSPACYSWNLKHDNHGLLLVEKNASCDISEEDILNGIHLLSFCPIH